MKRLLVGDEGSDRVFQLSDPDGPSEGEFEHKVARVLTQLYPHYRCILFSGSFLHDAEIFRPDMALVARDFSNWFVIEVELTSHSFERHVLPQVKAFRYGTPLPDCVTQLAAGLSVTQAQAQTLIEHVPRAVAVIVNRRETSWEIALRAHTIQLLAVSAYASLAGLEAFELDGEIDVIRESLGFGIYLATDRSLRFPKSVRLPLGQIQISDPAGAPSLWSVARDEQYAWITKDIGVPSIPNGSHIQLIRTFDGKITLRRPGAAGVSGG